MNNITNEQLDGLIKSAVNSSGPLPPDEKFSQIISALRELRDLRTAMLQGAEPVSNRDELTDGWVACSERLPPEGYEPDGGAVCYLVWHKNEVDCGPQYSISNVFFLRKHWEKNYTHWMPLPAAPQQEVK
ncbi:DUF551 domain-containing protein [Enterobacter hormaechei]|nr:DUF551 domain-containing protein [Enterobacter hormaechei]MCM7285590.1 DUF551 domain-containing protein [Enterobacter hormaechei]